MVRSGKQQGMYVLVSASLLAAVLGSVHAFSVFLTPLETAYGAARSTVSLTYSLALVCLTIAVLFGHRWYARWSPAVFVTLTCLLAAIGAGVAAMAPTIAVVWLGYGVLFGAANGLGYGFGLQIAAQARPGHEGSSMGIVTAAYAFGAALSPVLFAKALSYGGYAAAMVGLMAVLIFVGAICALLFHAAGIHYWSAKARQTDKAARRVGIAFLWLGYGAGVACGLMVIGHAAGIAKALSYDGPAWMAPAVIALCNLIGSLVAGALADRMSGARILAALPLMSAACVLALALLASPDLILLLLGGVGFAYGGIIAVYPAVISKLFGVLYGAAVYARVFTAWGSAGLFAPWLAGGLFDWTGSYQIALIVAGVLGVVSAIATIPGLLNRAPDSAQ